MKSKLGYSWDKSKQKELMSTWNNLTEEIGTTEEFKKCLKNKQLTLESYDVS